MFQHFTRVGYNLSINKINLTIFHCLCVKVLSHPRHCRHEVLKSEVTGFLFGSGRCFASDPDFSYSFRQFILYIIIELRNSVHTYSILHDNLMDKDQHIFGFNLTLTTCTLSMIHWQQQTSNMLWQAIK